jgi:hypothetical protein
MYVSITQDLIFRKRRTDGSDAGAQSLRPGKYQANQTPDGALEILQGAGETLYLLPFIWWEKMEQGVVILH